MATDFFDPVYLENVYAALFAQLQTATIAGGLKFQTSARTMTAPDEVPVTNQPAFYQVPGPLHSASRDFALPKWVFTAIIMIYLRAEGTVPTPDPLPQTQALNTVWGIVNALLVEDAPYEKQTLGGLVYHCWVEGEVTIQTASEQVTISIPIFIDAGNVG